MSPVLDAVECSFQNAETDIEMQNELSLKHWHHNCSKAATAAMHPSRHPKLGLKNTTGDEHVTAFSQMSLPRVVGPQQMRIQKVVVQCLLKKKRNTPHLVYT